MTTSPSDVASQTPSPLTFRRGLGEALLIGALAACAYVSAESLLLVWIGIRIGSVDPLLMLLAAAPLFLIGTTTAWILIWLPLVIMPRLRRTTREQVRWLLLGGVLLAYAAGGTIIARKWSDFTPVVIAAWVAAIVASLGTWLLCRRRRDIGSAALALIVGAFAFVGFTAWGYRADLIPGVGRLMQFTGGACIVPLAALAVLCLRRRPTTPAPRAFRPIAAIIVLTVVSGVLAAFGPRPVTSWQNRDERPGSVVSPARPDSPRVLLVVLDTVGAGHMELFGYSKATMPNLTRFAREECDYVAASASPGSWTGSSHGSMFTGLWPSSHGCWMMWLGDPNKPDSVCEIMLGGIPTLAEWLGGLGYRTGGISANFGPLRIFELDRGFQYYDARPDDAYRSRRVSWLGMGYRWIPAPNRLISERLPRSLRPYSVLFDRLRPDDRRAKVITESAREWLDHNGAGPYFLFLNYSDAHENYMPISGLDLPGTARPDWGVIPQRAYLRHMLGKETMPAERVRELSELYDLELSDLDRSLAELLGSLKSRPDYDNTIIVITSDHGEEFMEKGFLRHGNNVYEPQIRVPLMIRLPPALKHKKPAAVPAHFQTVDLFATVADLLDRKPPEMHGSAWGLGRDHALIESLNYVHEVPRLCREQHAVQIGSLKYARLDGGIEELFDLAADPHEQTNLIGQHPEMVARAKAILQERDRRAASVTGTKAKHGQAHKDRLRAMGYLSPGED